VLTLSTNSLLSNFHRDWLAWLESKQAPSARYQLSVAGCQIGNLEVRIKNLELRINKGGFYEGQENHISYTLCGRASQLGV